MSKSILNPMDVCDKCYQIRPLCFKASGLADYTFHIKIVDIIKCPAT